MTNVKVEVTRKVEHFLPDGTWEEKDFMDIDVTDIVRLFEVDGTPVVMGHRKNGEEYYTAYVIKACHANVQKEFEGIPTFEYMEIPC